MASQVVSQLGGRGVELMAGLLLTPAAVGLLRVGGQCLDMLMQLSVMPFYQLALPSFSRSLVNGRLDPEVFERLSRLSALLIFPVFFGAMTISKDVLPLLFGPQYASAGFIMAALCVMAVPLQLNLMLAPALTAVGRTDRVLAWSLIGAAVTLVASGLGALWGLVGLVVMMVGRMYLLAPLGLVWLNTYAGVPAGRVLGAVRGPLVAAVAMALCAYGAQLALGDHLSVAWRLAITVAVGIVSYVTLLLLLDRSVLADLRALRARQLSPVSTGAADGA